MYNYLHINLNSTKKQFLTGNFHTKNITNEFHEEKTIIAIKSLVGHNHEIYSF